MNEQKEILDLIEELTVSQLCLAEELQNFGAILEAAQVLNWNLAPQECDA